MLIAINNPLPNPLPSKGEGIKRTVSRRKATGKAKALRRTMTEAEKKLWRCLRAKRFSGYKFRRQYPVENYIADFACVHGRLIIELDGSQHAVRSRYDKNRDQFLKRQGFHVLRFWNNEIFENLEGVLHSIYAALQKHPLPLKGEGNEHTVFVGEG